VYRFRPGNRIPTGRCGVRRSNASRMTIFVECVGPATGTAMVVRNHAPRPAAAHPVSHPIDNQLGKCDDLPHIGARESQVLRTGQVRVGQIGDRAQQQRANGGARQRPVYILCIGHDPKMYASVSPCQMTWPATLLLSTKRGIAGDGPPIAIMQRQRRC
jgi:hypothetical protein